MRVLFTALVLSLVFLSPLAHAEGPEDDYMNIYATVLQADTLSSKGDVKGARAKYQEALTALKQLKAENPSWNVEAVKFRLQYLTAKLTAVPTNAPAKTPDAPARTGEQVTLKLKWEVGKRYLQHLDMVQNSDMKLPGSAQPMKQETRQGQDISITALKELEGGGRELEIEIQSMVISSKMGGKITLSFDSKKDASEDASNPAAPMFRKLVGVHIKFLTDPVGRMDKAEGFNELLDKLTAGMPELQAQMFRSIFSEGNLKEAFSAAQGLPDKPVQVGDTWPMKAEMALGPMGSVVQNSEYTLKGWEQHDNHKCALLEFSGTLSTPSDAAGAVSVTDGKTSGKTWFDPALGMVIETSARQNMNIKMSAGGQSIVTKSLVTTDAKLVSITDAK